MRAFPRMIRQPVVLAIYFGTSLLGPPTYSQRFFSPHFPHVLSLTSLPLLTLLERPEYEHMEVRYLLPANTF